MKKLIFSLTLAAASLAASAAVPGKTYAPGDTIYIDGYEALVYFVTPDGLHGDAILPPAMAEKDKAKADKRQEKVLKSVAQKSPAELYAETEKNMAKMVKSGHMTQEAADATLKQLRDAMATMDADQPIGDAAATAELPQDVVKPVKMDKKFMSRVYHLDEWKKDHPESWRLASVSDGSRIMDRLTGGLGRDHQYTVNDRAKLSADFTDFPRWQSMLQMMLLNGFLVLDNEGHPFIVMDFSAPATMRHWMELTDTCTGHELTVAVASF